MEISKDKENAIKSAMTQIDRQFGKGSIMKLGAREVQAVPVVGALRGAAPRHEVPVSVRRYALRVPRLLDLPRAF